MSNLAMVIGEECDNVVDALTGDGCEVIHVPDATRLSAKPTLATPDVVLVLTHDVSRNLEVFSLLSRWFDGEPVPVLMWVPPTDEQSTKQAMTRGVSDVVRSHDTPGDLVCRVRMLCRQRLLARLVLAQRDLLARRNAELVRLARELDQAKAGVGRRAERALVKHSRRLVMDAQRANGAQQLAAGVAHDLNNMLTVIVGHCQMAERALSGGHSARRSLAQIAAAAAKATESAQLLTQFAKHTNSPTQPVQVNRTLRAVGRLAGPLFGAGIRLEYRLRAKLPAVRADRIQLEHLLLNLCINARDAMPQGGTILLESDTVRTGVETSVVIKVKDTGTGMDDNVLAHCFEPFFTTKPAGRGTGLGLFNVLQTAQRWGGFVTVETERGRGTTFRLVLPLAAKRHARQRAPAPAPASTITVPTCSDATDSAVAEEAARVVA